MKTLFVHDTAMIVVESSAPSEMFRFYVDLIARQANMRIYTVTLNFTGGGAALSDAEHEIRNIVAEQKVDLIMAEWLHDPLDIQHLLQTAHKLKLSAVFVRAGNALPTGRLVVATGGGPNVCEQIWVARALSFGIELPVEICHWQPDLSEGGVIGTFCGNEDSSIEKMCASMMGVRVAVFQTIGPDFISATIGCLSESDLLVMGAPSPLRWTASFAGSLPEQMAKQVGIPLFLLSTPCAGRVNLRHLLWGRLIKPRMKARNKKHALEQLVDNLILHNELLADHKEAVLHQALERENLFSTAVDCQTAFPHVTLPGFFGVTASAGIFPEGVDFGSDDGALSKFVFLLITSDGFPDEHLTALSKIARRMVNEKVREDLLRSKTSEQALSVLEPSWKVYNL